MKIAFFTTSLFTDVQDVSSSLIAKNFPDCAHLLIDGKEGLFSNTILEGSWYNWIESAKNIDCDYAIHVDEDCFLLSRKSVFEIIEKMESEGWDIAGPRDGGSVMREHNPFAMNAFFLIVKKTSLITPTEILFYKDEYAEGETPEAYSRTDLSFGGRTLYNYHVNAEPYYSFFWNLKSKGKKFLYLEDEFNSELSTTDLLEGNIVHAWYLRLRRMKDVVCCTHKYCNSERYDKILQKVKNQNN